MINRNRKQLGLAAFITIIVVALFLAFTHAPESNNNVADNDSNNKRITANDKFTGNFNLRGTTTEVESTTAKMKVHKLSKNKKAAKRLLKKTAKYRKKYKDRLPYMITVNRDENFVTVYTLDKNGECTIPYKTFWCSTGLNPEDTPLGTYSIYQRYDWRLMVDGTYAQYAVRIYGQIMLHSVPYTSDSHDSLEYWEYNKIGKPASLGCVRLQAGNIKWIYDNCPDGTIVTIYSQKGEKPLIKIKKIKKIKKKNKNRNWDPTDPQENNPWLKKEPKETTTVAETTTAESKFKINNSF